jgi:5-methylcytosine-specific restriction endonuclease McrA
MTLTRCLDCGRRCQGSRCDTCQRQRGHVRNRGPAQHARLSISRAQRERVYARDGYRCLDCGRTGDLTLDHVVPLAVQLKARYRDDELVTLCRSCNSRRGAGKRREPPDAALASLRSHPPRECSYKPPAAADQRE